MTGLIVLVVSILSCVLFQIWRNSVVEYFNARTGHGLEPEFEFYTGFDRLASFLAPLIAVGGIVAIWFGYKSHYWWSMGYSASIVWTVVLLIVAVIARLVNALRSDHFEDDDEGGKLEDLDM